MKTQMYMTIKMTDGKTVYTDPSIYPAEYHESVMESMEGFKALTTLAYMSVKIDGKERVLNPQHVLWYEIVVNEDSNAALTWTAEQLEDMGMRAKS